MIKYLSLGNPGLVEYYSTFIKELYKELKGSTAVWALSHACHSLKIHGDNCSTSFYDKLHAGM